MWGYPIAFWQSIVLWTMWLGFAFTALGAAIAVISSFLSYHVSDVTQADADKRIADAGITAARANEVAAKAQERAALLEKDAALARLEVERLRAQLAGRRLTPDQSRRLTAEFATMADLKITVAAISTDPEAMIFAADIIAALSAAGQQPGEIVSSIPFSGAPVIGVRVKGTRENLMRVGNALISSGVPVPRGDEKPTDGAAVQIFVASKPPAQ